MARANPGQLENWGAKRETNRINVRRRWLVGAILRHPVAAWPRRLWMARQWDWAKTDGCHGSDGGGRGPRRGYSANTRRSYNGLENSSLWPEVLMREKCSYKCLLCYSLADWYNTIMIHTGFTWKAFTFIVLSTWRCLAVSKKIEKILWHT